jgi:hypothetical protein
MKRKAKVTGNEEINEARVGVVDECKIKKHSHILSNGP